MKQKRKRKNRESKRRRKYKEGRNLEKKVIRRIYILILCHVISVFHIVHETKFAYS
jgi:hypothetical protein